MKNSKINYNELFEVNKDSWNKQAVVNYNSEFYNNNEFQKGKSSLNSIELGLLGDISNKSILHLQCHFGQDSISLSRLGANVTGVDFSEKAIELARNNSGDTNTKFICCNVYDLQSHLNEKFDIIFTSYGTIGWLPDLDKWASIISSFLKPKGKFVFVEFHPFIWMYDNDFNYIQYQYFNRNIIEEIRTGTYADRDADVEIKTISWNHSLSEVVTSLLKNGLSIDDFQEYDYSPYDCFNDTIKYSEGVYRIKNFGDKVPLVYSIVATKKC